MDFTMNLIKVEIPDSKTGKKASDLILELAQLLKLTTRASTTVEVTPTNKGLVFGKRTIEFGFSTEKESFLSEQALPAEEVSYSGLPSRLPEKIILDAVPEEIPEDTEEDIKEEIAELPKRKTIAEMLAEHRAQKKHIYEIFEDLDIDAGTLTEGILAPSFLKEKVPSGIECICHNKEDLVDAWTYNNLQWRDIHGGQLFFLPTNKAITDSGFPLSRAPRYIYALLKAFPEIKKGKFPTDKSDVDLVLSIAHGNQR